MRYVRDPNDPKHPKYDCRCECGNLTRIGSDNLARTHSCGCLKKEQLARRSTTHGMSSSLEFKTWVGMIDRCSRVGRTDFARYGGRGIRVCQRWLDSFENFYADMGSRPSRKHSIDRINNDGDYEPQNCRWATPHDQRVNQRRVELLTFEGVTGTAKDLARHFGLSYTAIHQRLNLMKWSVHKTFSTPVKNHRKRQLQLLKAKYGSTGVTP